MRKFALLLTLIAIMGIQVVLAQSKQIRGNVTSAEDGSVLPGVSIVVKGTTIGTVTDIDGNYSLSVPQDVTTLVFSFIGMESKEVEITGDVINVKLKLTTIGVDEVIVTAYGKTTKEAYTGSATMVKGDKLIKSASPVSADKALQGYVSGVRITQQEGQPGAAANIQIRGVGSINGNTKPLYVVDGIPVATGNLSGTQTSSNLLTMLNPGDIESITVLKDAAATSLYGSRGANGVVIITTKSGESGKTKISANVEYGISNIAMPNELTGYYMNSTEYTSYSVEALKNYYLYAHDALPGQSNGENYSTLTTAATDWAYSNLNEYAGIIHPDDNLDGSFDYSTADRNAYYSRPRYTNWGDLIFRTGNEKKIDISAQGGTKDTKHYFSLGYLKQDGIYIGSDYERYTGKLRLENKVNKYFSYDVSENLAYSVQNGAATGDTYYVNPIFGMMVLNPTQPAYLDNAKTEYNPEPGFTTSVPNYLQSRNDESSTAKIFKSTTLISATLNFTDWLYFKTSNGIDINNLYDSQIWGISSHDGDSYGGYVFGANIKMMEITSSNVLNFDKKFLGHSISTVIGYEVFDHNYSIVGAGGSNFSSDKLLYLSNAATPESVSGGEDNDRLVSYLGRLDYSYNDKYYATLSIRRDGSSRLSELARWGNFWSASGGWIVKKESFLENANWLDNLKLKASYGTSGNLPIEFYDSQALYSVSGSYNNEPAIKLSSKGNPQYTWEHSYTLNTGLEFAIFNRISGTLEYYNKLTDKLINRAPTSYTTGFEDQPVNRGKLRNTGVEFSVDTKNITGEFSWTTNFNITYMKAMVEELEEFIDDFPYRIQQGEKMYSFYLREWAGVNPETGQPQWYVNSENADGSLNKTITSNASLANKTFVGKGYPDFFGGLTNTFDYKGFELSFLLTYTFGGVMYDDNYAATVSDGSYIGQYMPAKAAGEDYWQKPGDVSTNPIVVYNNPNNSAYNSNRRLKSTDHVRIKNISLAYNLPKSFLKKAGIDNIRLYVQGNNVYTFYKYDYINPEVDFRGTSSGSSYFPLLKSWKVGVNINF